MLQFLANPPVPPARHIERTGDDTPVRTIWRFAWRMGGHHQIWICLVASVVAALSMAPFELQRLIINEAIGTESVDSLILFGALYLLVMLLLAAFKLAFRIYQSWLSESAVHYVRVHLIGLHHERTSAGNAGEDAAGHAVPIVNKEAEQVGGFVGEGISGPFVEAATFTAILAFMLVTEPVLALIAGVFLVPQVVAMPLLQKLINRLIESRIDLQRDLANMVAEIEPGNDKLPDPADLRERVGSVYRNRMRIFVLKFLGKLVINLLNGLAPLAALVVGGYFVIQDETSLGVVVAFVGAFERLSDPLRQLVNYYRLYARTQVQHDKIAEWMT